jgi:hypothetical protein
MKKLLLLSLLAFCVNGFCVKWQKLTKGYDGNGIYIDIANIEANESRVYYSNLIDFLDPKGKSYSVVSKYKVDCGEEQITWLRTDYYSQPMGKGKITSRSSVKQIRVPQTDTIARAELLFVCRWSELFSQ